jgi:hypothetical protein
MKEYMCGCMTYRRMVRAVSVHGHLVKHCLVSADRPFVSSPLSQRAPTT